MSTDTPKKKRRLPKPTPTPVDSRYRLLSVDELLTLTGWSLRTLERRLADEEFPQPIEGSNSGRRKWTLAQYEAWAKRAQDAANQVA